VNLARRLNWGLLKFWSFESWDYTKGISSEILLTLNSIRPIGKRKILGDQKSNNKAFVIVFIVYVGSIGQQLLLYKIRNYSDVDVKLNVPQCLCCQRNGWSDESTSTLLACHTGRLRLKGTFGQWRQIKRNTNGKIEEILYS